MLARSRLAGTTGPEASGDSPIAQLRTMRMFEFAALVLVDLPVDVVVVFEQQEGAGEARRIERALRNG